jgi:GDP-4-dehydro-6-deoxy-D-mannose reductase
MKVLVTGVNGFVGSHLVPALDPHEVHGFSRGGWPSATSMPTPPDYLHQGDIRRYEDIRRVVERVNPDQIFHLAAQAYVPEGGTDPHRAIDVNTVGTLNLLEAVRHTGTRARVLIAGTSEEYGYEGHEGHWMSEEAPCLPTTVYGVSKLAATQLGMVYAKTYGIPVVATRAWNHTGPGHSSQYAIPSFAKAVAEVEKGKRPAVRHGNLEAVRAYLDVRDVVEAYVRAIECEPGMYNVSPTMAMSMGEWLNALIGLTDSADIPLEPDPALYRPGMQAGTKSFPLGDSTKLRQASGWEPHFHYPLTLSDVLNYWRARV